MGRDNKMMRGPHNVSQKQGLKTMGIFGLGKNREGGGGPTILVCLELYQC